MRRAFIGFSSPVGYDTQISTTKTRNDRYPDTCTPMVFGTTGLLILYDEIFFACESLCPENMRALPYVKFLDQEYPSTDLLNQSFHADVELAYKSFPEDLAFQNAGLSSAEHQDFCETHYGGYFADHQNGLAFMGTEVLPKPGVLQCIIDAWIINRYKELDLAIVINPLTARNYFQSQADAGTTVEATLRKLEISEKLITLKNVVDFRGPNGPYHPVIEELRADSDIRYFRQWLNDSCKQWHNREVSEIVNCVDAIIDEFVAKRLANDVSPSLVKLVVSVAKGLVVEQIEWLGLIAGIADEVRQYQTKRQNKNEYGWQAFIARAQHKTKPRPNASTFYTPT